MSHLNDPLVRARAAESRKGKRRGPYKWVNKPGPKEESRKRLSVMLKADPVSRRPGIAAKIAAANRGKAWSLNSETGRRVYQPKPERKIDMANLEQAVRDAALALKIAITEAQEAGYRVDLPAQAGDLDKVAISETGNVAKEETLTRKPVSTFSKPIPE